MSQSLSAFTQTTTSPESSSDGTQTKPTKKKFKAAAAQSTTTTTATRTMTTKSPTRATPTQRQSVDEDDDEETLDQATLIVGTLGHVAHGKSTLVRALSGVKTQRHHDELKKGISIKLGYGNAKLYRCTNWRTCLAAYSSQGSKGPRRYPCPARPACAGTHELKRHVSFVDCPGHEVLMTTMLTGVSVMDCALLIVSSVEQCPQAQTSEHLAAADMMSIRPMAIIQNKIDLVGRERAYESKREIDAFVRGTCAEGAPVYPVAAEMGINTDMVVRWLIEMVPAPVRSRALPLRATVIRSFDVNTPGTEVDKLKGGIAGLKVTQGTLSIKQRVEIRPGLVRRDSGGTLRATPLITRIDSLFSEGTALKSAHPGGLIGAGTCMDPVLTRKDRLVGQVMGAPGTLPSVYAQVELTCRLMSRVVGDARTPKIAKITKGSRLQLNAAASRVSGQVSAVHRHASGSLVDVRLLLDELLCANVGDMATISARIDGRWRLVGHATVGAGIQVEN